PGTIDQSLAAAEHRALGRGGDDDLAPALALVRRLGCLVLVSDGLPHPLEDRAGDQPAEDADEQAEGLVDQARHTGAIPRIAASDTRRSPEAQPPRARISGDGSASRPREMGAGPPPRDR